MSETERPIIPPHQWTHDGAKVLILRCDDADSISHKSCPTGCTCGGKAKNFRWPDSGPVESPNWSPKPTCASGGLFGWAWGLGLGSGKDPDYTGRWRVFAADPTDVVGNIEGEPKCKASRGEVVFVGTWYAAMTYVRDGQRAWIAQAARGEGHATGDSSASSATGDRSASSATGDRSASSATGDRSASSATGYISASSATGDSSASSATGDSSASSATGYSSASSATGDSSASSATGDRSIAANTGTCGRVEVGAGGLAVSTSDDCFWTVRDGATFVQRWAERASNGDVVAYHTFVLESSGLNDGDVLHIVCGEVV